MLLGVGWGGVGGLPYRKPVCYCMGWGGGYLTEGQYAIGCGVGGGVTLQKASMLLGVGWGGGVGYLTESQYAVV